MHRLSSPHLLIVVSLTLATPTSAAERKMPTRPRLVDRIYQSTTARNIVRRAVQHKVGEVPWVRYDAQVHGYFGATKNFAFGMRASPFNLLRSVWAGLFANPAWITKYTSDQVLNARPNLALVDKVRRAQKPWAARQRARWERAAIVLEEMMSNIGPGLPGPMRKNLREFFASHSSQRAPTVTSKGKLIEFANGTTIRQTADSEKRIRMRLRDGAETVFSRDASKGGWRVDYEGTAKGDILPHRFDEQGAYLE